MVRHNTRVFTNLSTRELGRSRMSILVCATIHGSGQGLIFFVRDETVVRYIGGALVQK